MSKVTRMTYRQKAAGKDISLRQTQEERRAKTRASLLKAALAVLRDEGYANLTITKVANRAGYTNGAMQHHFPARDDLVLALLDEVYPVLEISFDSLLQEKLGLGARMQRAVDIYWRVYSEPEYLAVWDISLGARGEEKLWKEVRRYQQHISQHIRSEFLRLFARERLTPSGADLVVSVVVSALRGLAFQRLFGVQTDPEVLQSITRSAVAEVKRHVSRQTNGTR